MRITAIILGVAIATAAVGCEAGTEPTAVQPADKGNAKSTAPKNAGAVTVKMTATKTTAQRSALSDGSALSCVKVTVTNQRKKTLAVNPLYFSIVDTGGEKHETSDALGDYEGQIATTTLAPGEKAKGTVCGKGEFTPKVVAMTNELLQEQARAEVG